MEKNSGKQPKRSDDDFKGLRERSTFICQESRRSKSRCSNCGGSDHYSKGCFQRPTGKPVPAEPRRNNEQLPVAAEPGRNAEPVPAVNVVAPEQLIVPAEPGRNAEPVPAVHVVAPEQLIVPAQVPAQLLRGAVATDGQDQLIVPAVDFDAQVPAQLILPAPAVVDEAEQVPAPDPNENFYGEGKGNKYILAWERCDAEGKDDQNNEEPQIIEHDDQIIQEQHIIEHDDQIIQDQIIQEQEDQIIQEQDQHQNNDTFGGWERYSRAFGSRMMAKMGYTVGDGLGADRQGIVEPIRAPPLPPPQRERMGLDYFIAFIKEKGQ